MLSGEATEVLAVHACHRHIPSAQIPAGADLPKAGMSRRTIVPRRLLENPAAAAHCGRLHAAGDRHRITDKAIQRMVILDRAIAFIPAAPNTPGGGTLMIRQPGAVATLADLFEGVWAHATDLESADAIVLSDHERQILRLMATVAKDEVAARSMGIAVRTYRRHVAKLLITMRATHRVHAALIAQHRGWL
ncbi:LuxR C-terminal-related transcriptional regulator [Nonomuraea sp. NPDC050547]|uniref:helix-turn-helix transcriptional regulator n=1 Tax=unclassified Nonomuraea TaxID=2593643 RepID=UPI0037A66B58